MNRDRDRPLFDRLDAFVKEHHSDVAAIARQIRDSAASGDFVFARLLRNFALAGYPRHAAIIEAGEQLPPEFDQAFFEPPGSTTYLSALTILRLVRSRFRFERVVDVGAGMGKWLQAADQCGAADLMGIEGPWVQALPRYPKAEYIFADLNKPLSLERSFDLAICVEVAEHLQPARSATLVGDLCRLSEVVIFGGALPRQYGDGHLNCRSHLDWIALFHNNGFICRDYFRPKLWTDPFVAPWYRQNTFLFTSAKDSVFADVPSPTLVDVYHPLLLYSPFDFLVRQDHAPTP
jgi:hypothetical protein